MQNVLLTKDNPLAAKSRRLGSRQMVESYHAQGTFPRRLFVCAGRQMRPDNHNLHFFPDLPRADNVWDTHPPSVRGFVDGVTTVSTVSPSVSSFSLCRRITSFAWLVH
jgi:hypothetical protein